MENTPEKLPNLKLERRHCSNVGMALLIYAVLSLVLQFGAQMLLSEFAPAMLDIPLVFFAALLLPTYIVGTPLCALTMRFSPPDKIEKKKLRPRQFFVALLMCFTLMYAGNLVGNLLGSLADMVFKGSSGISDLLTNSTPLANLVFVVLLAPIVEELIFRKFIVDRLVRYGEVPAIICSGMLFGLFHGNFYQFFYAALLGIFFAFIYAKTGRIRITILLHTVVNFFGGFVAPIILDLLGPDYETVIVEYMELITTVPANIEAYNQILDEALALISPIVPGLLALGFYNTLFMGAVIAGLVMLIVNRRKFKCAPGRINLEGNTFLVTWINVGVILFSVMCAVMFALNLTA